MSTNLSIVIVSFNTKAILKDCLDSLIASEIKFEHEIIVVDNASQDGTIEMLENDFPGIYLIKNNENLMFAKANNLAIKNSIGEFILFINSDTIVKSNSIDTLVDFLISNPDITCAGPRVLNKDGSLQSEGKHHDNIFSFLCYWTRFAKWPIPEDIKLKFLPLGFPNFQQGKIREVGWVSGCCMLVRRTDFLEIGGFDESLNFYCEETEWCYRAQKLGFKIYVNPSVYVIHLGGASTFERSYDYKTYLDYRKKTIGLKKTVLKHIVIIGFFTPVLPFLIIRPKILKTIGIEVFRSIMILFKIPFYKLDKI